MTETRPRSHLMAGLAGLSCIAGAAILFVSAADQPSENYLLGVWRFRHVALAGGMFMLAAACLAAWVGRNAALVFWASVIPALLFLGVLEGAGRLGVVKWEALLGGSIDLSDNPGWSLAPNVLVEGETYQDTAVKFRRAHDPIPFRFQTDSYGFRNGEGPEADIIILGDSIVLGALVPKAQTVDSVVGDTLDVPVMQAALLGIAIQEQHSMLLQAGVPLDGKRIVQFFFEGNDLLDSYELPTKTDTASGDDEIRSLIRLLWNRLVRSSHRPSVFPNCDIDGQEYLFTWLRNSFEDVDGEFDKITAAILAFREEVRQAGAEYALVFAPTKYRILHPHCAFPEGSQIAAPEEQLSDLPDRLRGWARDAGIDYLDLTGALAGAAARGDTPWFWGDTHWNADGHAAAGKAVANWLAER